MIKSKGSSGNLTQIEGPYKNNDTNEPIAPCVIDQKLNLRKLLGQSNPQSSEQLMTIKTSTSTEMATMVYFVA